MAKGTGGKRPLDGHEKTFAGRGGTVAGLIPVGTGEGSPTRGASRSAPGDAKTFPGGVVSVKFCKSRS